MKILALLVGLLAVMGAALYYQLIPPLSLALLAVGGGLHATLIVELNK